MVRPRRSGPGGGTCLFSRPCFGASGRRVRKRTPRRSGTEPNRCGPTFSVSCERLSAADPATFVVEAYRALLGSTPDDAGRAFHISILEKGFEDRAALLDTVTTSRGFLDLYRPFVPEIPWFAAYEIFMRLGEAPRTGDFFELVAAVTSRLEGRPPPDAVAFGFKTILGFEADEEALRHHLSLVEDHPDGYRLFVRELLSSRKFPAPPAAKIPHAALLPGESAPGEAARAKEMLDEGHGREDRAFVRLAYERVFGRAADADGEAFYLGKLSQGELSRPAFLRELLWSEEGARRGRLL